jgi:hypothetical protein
MFFYVIIMNIAYIISLILPFKVIILYAII